MTAAGEVSRSHQVAEDSATYRTLRRLHPLTPVLKGWLFFAALAVLIAQESLRELDFSRSLAQVGVALVLALLVGFTSWWFTKYGVDGEEMRIDRGVLFRRSRQIRIDRLQAVDIVRPVQARVLGLAELRLELAGGKTAAPLAYLSETSAQRLRAELLARAAGLSADTPEAPERRLVSVPPFVLLASALVSAPFVVAAVGFVVVAVATLWVDSVLGLAFLLPWTAAGVGVLWRQFLAEFGFTVSESPDGLRIRKGLLDTWAQTVPPGRVQGIEIEQQLLWRPKNWVKVSVSVAGYGFGGEEAQAASTLLPVAPWPVARAVLERVLPGVEIDHIYRCRAPRRSMLLRPIGWRRLRYGVGEQAVVTERGWLTRRTSVVWHAKTQSVRITQGPLQRLLRLGSVHVDTPVGPVRAVAYHLDATRARALAEGQAERARHARRAASPQQWMRSEGAGDAVAGVTACPSYACSDTFRRGEDALPR